MVAVFETGGKQYRVAEGDIVYAERLDAEDGAELVFDTVLAVMDEEKVKTGAPYIPGVTVTATVVKSGKGKKIIVYKMKRRKNYRRKQGHRQPYTQLEITDVEKTVMKAKAKKTKKEEVS